MQITDLQITDSTPLHQLVAFTCNEDRYVLVTYKQGYKGVYPDGETYQPITHTRVYRNKSALSVYKNDQFMPVDPNAPEQTISKLFKLMMLE